MAKQTKQTPATVAPAAITTDDDRAVQYQKGCALTVATVKGDNEVAHGWKATGHFWAGFFPSQSVMEESKVQFMADAIVPGLTQDDRDALSYDGRLPRKGSKAFKELTPDQQKTWEENNTALRNARAKRDTYFTRVMKYAFPPQETETAPRDLAMRIIEECTKLYKACEKSEDAEFNVIPVMDLLQSVIDAVRDGDAE